MTEELKVPTISTPPPPAKPKVSYVERLSKMSKKQLIVEAKRISKTDIRYDGMFADTLLIAFFKAPRNINDPYMLETRTTPFFEIKGGKNRAS